MEKAPTKPKPRRFAARATAEPKAGRVTVKKTGGGVVGYCIHGASGRTAAQEFTPSMLIRTLKEGLAIHELDDLRRDLDMSMDSLVPMLGISRATLHRRKTTGRLDPSESDRVVRFARLLGKAREVLGSMDSARRWLNSPQVGLGGAVPLKYAETEVGAREVEDLLGRIEYGVYS